MSDALDVSWRQRRRRAGKNDGAALRSYDVVYGC